MKLCTVALAIFMSFSASAQSTYTYTHDGASVIVNGVFTKYLLQNDPAFSWYEFSQNNYQPDSDILETMQSAKGKFTFLVFGGTWCEDTQNILPKFFMLQEKTGIPDGDVSLIGVDRAKKSIGNLAAVMGITNVPTIIVLKNGKEVGRVIEYGPTGKWDEALSGLLK